MCTAATYKLNEAYNKNGLKMAKMKYKRNIQELQINKSYGLNKLVNNLYIMSDFHNLC